MGEGNRTCFNNESVKEPLNSQDGEASAHPGVLRAAWRRILRVPGGWPTHRPMCVLVLVALVLALVLALVVAVAAAVAALSAGRHGGDPAVPAAPVLVCAEGWNVHRNVCYYFSKDEGSWEWSQEQCSSHGASLAMPKSKEEREFLWHHKGGLLPWLGLRRRGERLEWVDGSSFNQTFEVRGRGDCAYLYDNAVGSAGCAQSRPYVCSSSQALGDDGERAFP